MMKYSRLSFLFLTLFCAVTVQAAAGKYSPLVIAPYAQDAQNPFKNSKPTREFVEQAYAPAAGKKAPVKTVAYAAFDKKNLYFKYVMENINIYDMVELFISSGANHHNYVQVYLAVRNPNGFSTLKSAMQAPEMKKHISQRIEKKGSTWILYLTLDRAGFPELVENDFIRVNFNRTVVSPKLSNTCWSNTMNGFQQPDRFGWMILRSEKDFCRKYYAVEVQDELDLIRKYDRMVPGHLDRAALKGLENTQRGFMKNPSLATGENLKSKVIALREKFTEELIKNQFQPKK